MQIYDSGENVHKVINTEMMVDEWSVRYEENTQRGEAELIKKGYISGLKFIKFNPIVDSSLFSLKTSLQHQHVWSCRLDGSGETSGQKRNH